MRKYSLLIASILGLSLTAVAEADRVGEGSAIAQPMQIEPVESGSDFSYARVWGPGRAYDGTDTSIYVAGLRAQTEPAKTALNLRPRSEYITRPPALRRGVDHSDISLRGRLDDR